MNAEHFIPISIKTLKTSLEANSSELLTQIFSHLIHIYQYQSHHLFTHLKELYQSYNPDIELIITNTQSETELISEITKLLTRANYVKLNQKELEQSLNDNTHLGLNITVDTDDYKVFDIYYRGRITRTTQVKKYFQLFGTKEIEIEEFSRVFVVAKLKSQDQRAQEISQQKNISFIRAQKQVSKIYAKLPKDVTSEHLYFKLFKDIPTQDIETLFFTRTIKLKLFDKLRLALTGGISTTTGVLAAVGKLSASLSPFAVISALGGLVAIIIKQVTNLFNQHNKYMSVLTSSLYFHNLGNNLSAISSIANSSFEEEVKEVLLGYYFLSQRPYQDIAQLDRDIEQYLQDTYAMEIDFDVADSVAKLRSLGLVDVKSLATVPHEQAVQILQRYWQELL